MKIKHIAMAVATLLGTSAALAVPAGKVLVVAGQAVAERAGQELKLFMGAPVESGDVIRVADKSSIQIRFSDESVVSLQARSTFRIDDYRYNKNPQEDKSAFSIVKGGMRTITGLIGKSNPKNYSVGGSVATIGIRGTHFTVVACTEAGECKDGNGKDAPTGMYGGVSDGRIGVVNDAGDVEFGQQEYFYVESRNRRPVRLLSPPPMLDSDFDLSLLGEVDRTGMPFAERFRKLSLENNGTAEQQTTSPQPAGVRLLSVPVPTLALNETPALVEAASGGTTPEPTPTPTPSPTPAQGPLATLGVGYVPGSANTGLVVEKYDLQWGGANGNQTTSSSGVAFPYNGVFYTSAANLAAAIQASGGSVLLDPTTGGYVAWDGYVHTAFGNYGSSNLFPTAGIALFNMVLATTPTDSLGRSGTATLPALLVNFGSSLISTTAPLQMAFAASGAIPATTFSLSFTDQALSNSVSSVTGTSTGASAFRAALVGTSGSVSASCTGCDPSSGASVTWSGAFISDGQAIASTLTGSGVAGGKAFTGASAAIFAAAPTTTMAVDALATKVSAGFTIDVNSSEASQSLDQYLAAKKASGVSYSSVITASGERFYWGVEQGPSSSSDHHQAWGASPVSLPTSGSASYEYAGGTTPTDNSGRSGSISSAMMTVNFGSQTMTANTDPGIRISFPAVGNFSAVSYRMTFNNVPINGVAQSIPTLCSGGCASREATGFANLQFAGTAGQAVIGALGVGGLREGRPPILDNLINAMLVRGSTRTIYHTGAAAVIWTRQ